MKNFPQCFPHPVENKNGFLWKTTVYSGFWAFYPQFLVENHVENVEKFDGVFQNAGVENQKRKIISHFGK